MNYTKFQALLEDQVDFPTSYQFKFITKTEQKHRVIELLNDHIIQEKPSKNGKYTSISSRKMLQSSDEIIKVYKRVAQVDGVITL